MTRQPVPATPNPTFTRRAHKPIWELLNDDTELIGTGGSIGGENPQPGENTQPGGPQDDPIEGRQTQ